MAAPSTTDKNHRLLKRIVCVATITIAAFTCAAFVPRWGGQLRAMAFSARGQTGVCSLEESLDSVRVTAAQISGAKRIAEKTRLVEQDSLGLKLWDTPRGRFWVPASSEEAVEYDLAEQERKIYGSGQTGVHPGDIVLDCGANIGVYTREALANGARLVIAIEPAPENLECLRRNMAAEISSGRVIVYPRGVWDKDDILTMNIDPKNSARDSFIRLYNGARGIQVPLTTIDNLVADLKLPRVDFIKMDIEGAEQKAVAGARQTLMKFRPRMALCVYHLADDPVMVPKLVRAMVPDYQVAFECLNYEQNIQAEVAHFY